MNRILLSSLLLLGAACGAASSDVRASLVLEGGPGGDHEAHATFDDSGESLSVDTMDGDAVVANVTVWFNAVPTPGTYRCASLFNASWGVATSENNWESGCLTGPDGSDLTVELHEVKKQGTGYVMHGRATGIAAALLDAPGTVTVNAIF